MHSGTVNAKSKPGGRLAELTRVVCEVDSAPDLDNALEVLVRRTREVMGVDVCTVYFTDEGEQRHVVVATDGLASRVVGRLGCGFGKGLIGRVAESRRPLNLEQVPPELDQDFLRQTGGGPYQSFLGVPVVHKTRVHGVLLVRQRKPRRFDDSDEALLITLAAQLGGAIAYAKASGEWCRVCRPEESVPRRIEGLPGAPGLTIGHGVVVFGGNQIDRIPDRAVSDIQAEEARLCAAIHAVREEIAALNVQLERTLSETDRALFGAYDLLLSSPEILDAASAEVRQGNWAPGSVSRSFETHASRFDAMEDPYLRERAADIRALGGRIVARLLGGSGTLAVGPGATVLIGQCLSAIDIGRAQNGNLVGIITDDGSPLSHAAILARALGIPAVVGVSGLPLARLDGHELAVDGTAGHVHLRLTPSMRQAFERSIASQQDLAAALESVRELDAVTADGATVALFMNAGLRTDLELATATGSEGIGLLRSELPFMLFDRLPSEQEQQQLYRQALQAVHPLPVTLRTLDVGGDKALPYLTDAEANPALGQRGIRFTLDHPEIFLTQLRAALRADLGLGNLRLLLPMITGLDELEQARDLVEQALEQLQDEGLRVSRPPVGVMIEVPAAVYQAEPLARRADFLSVGTNDLAQYLLATDRNNPRASGRLDSAHPALLQALQQVVDSASRAGKPVTVCGEIAGDPAIALLLLGMGVDGLSMNPSALVAVKWAVRSVTSERMHSLAAEALRCETPEAICRLLDAVRADIGLERLASESASSNPPWRSQAAILANGCQITSAKTSGASQSV
jgi:phosphotransferase system enzyme I (PtsP)